MPRHPILGAIVLPVLLTLPCAAPGQTLLGDCAGDGAVALGEVQIGFAIFLGHADNDDCPTMDADDDADVTLGEVQRAFRNFFGLDRAILVRGECKQSGESGLVACDEDRDGEMSVVVTICQDQETCLAGDPTVESFGRIGRAGRFTFVLDLNRVQGMPLVFAAVIDAQTGTIYRVISFGRLGRVPSGGAGGGERPPDVVISPSSEAAVRLIDERGFEKFDDAGVIDVAFAVDAANADVSFAGLDAAQASDLATETARNDPDVIDTIECNTGGGTSCPPRKLAVGERPSSVAIGDFDGDSIPDIVAANEQSDDVSILLGLGQGRFSAQVRYEVGGGPRAVVIADIDLDDDLDVITANLFSNDASILPGVGDGRFGGNRRVRVGMRPVSVAVGDLNGDARPDLATANTVESGDVSIVLTRPEGGFQDAVNLDTGSGSNVVRIAAIDGDLIPDVAAANADADAVSILIGSGGGAFAPALRLAFASPSDLALADLNGDGNLDLVTTSPNNDAVSRRIASEPATFGESTDFPVGIGPFALTVVDLDGDTQLDVVTANIVDGSVSTLLGRGDGTFHMASHLPADASPGSIAVADLDGDGTHDIVTANPGSNDVSVLLRP